MMCFVTIQRMLEMINGTRMTRMELIYTDFLNYIHALKYELRAKSDNEKSDT